MMTLLIVIGLVLLFWYYVLPYLLRRQIRKTFGFDPRGERDGKNKPQQPEPKVQKKKIDPTVGEYVEFIETVTQTRVETPEGDETTTNIEQQITDVQWEDLPPKE